MVVQRRVSMLCGVNLQRTVSQSHLTFLIKVLRTALSRRQVSKQTPQRTAVNEHLSGNSRGRKEDASSGVLVLVAQRLLRLPKAFAAVNDPNAKHIYVFFFRQERYPASHLLIQLGLPTRIILSKHFPTRCTHHRQWTSGGSQRATWFQDQSFNLKNRRSCLCSAALNRGPGVLSASKYPWFKPASEAPSSNRFSSRVTNVPGLGRSATVAWTSDLPLLPQMETKCQGYLRQRPLDVERAGSCWNSKAKSYRTCSFTARMSECIGSEWVPPSIRFSLLSAFPSHPLLCRNKLAAVSPRMLQSIFSQCHSYTDNLLPVLVFVSSFTSLLLL